MTAVEREELIVSTLPLIKHIAHKVAMRLPNTVDIQDLINAGALGLLDAIDKFEPERGVKFKTYAEVRVRGAIIDSLRSLDWAPRSLRKKSKELDRVYSELAQQLGRPATEEEVSKASGTKLEDLHSLIDQLNGLTIGSFESPSDSDDKGGGTPIDLCDESGANDPYLTFETKERVSILAEALDSLPERERMVMSLYYYEEFTMKEIGTLMGVNESRVSQIHTKAAQRLRGKLSKEGTVLQSSRAAGR